MTSKMYTHLVQVYFESYLVVILVLSVKYKIPIDLLTACDYLAAVRAEFFNFRTT